MILQANIVAFDSAFIFARLSLQLAASQSTTSTSSPLTHEFVDLEGLVVNGLNRLYEISRVFCYEGIDLTRNPSYPYASSTWFISHVYDIVDLMESLVRVVVKHSKWGQHHTEFPPGREGEDAGCMNCHLSGHGSLQYDRDTGGEVWCAPRETLHTDETMVSCLVILSHPFSLFFSL